MLSNPKRIGRWGALPFLALLPFPRSAQTSPQEPPQAPSSIKVTTRLVVLSVIVTDKFGNPITDLTEDDFKVLENNQPQIINTFEVPSRLDSDPSSVTASTAGAVLASPLPRTILVLDQLNTTSEDLMYAKQKIRSFLEQQPARLAQPTTLFTLTKRRLELLGGPTQDRDALLTVFKKSILELPPHYLESGGVQGGADRLLASLLALDEIVLASGKDRTRKNLVWVGSGMPILSSYDVSFTDRERHFNWVHYTANWLQETQTTVYTVDPRGLEVAPTSFATDYGNVIASGPAIAPSELIFESIAPESGGKIFARRNDIDFAIADAVREGGSSYTLSYYPIDHNWDSKFRAIQVAVSRPGITARTQRGYFAYPEGFEGGGGQIEFGLSRAVTSPLPFHSVDFSAFGQLTNDAAKTPHERSARLVLAIQRDSLSWTPQANGNQRAEVTLVTSEISSSGRVLGYRVREVEVVLTKSQLEGPSAHDPVRLSVRVDLPAQTDHLRLVVRDASSGHLGTFDLATSSLAAEKKTARQ
jgi:VWFA-related protein